MAVPEQIKKDNWTFYVLSRSHDPSIMIPNTRKLISSLISTAKLLQDNGKNKEFTQAMRFIKRAWYEYSDTKNWGKAVDFAESALDQVTPIVYDIRYATPQQNSFIGDFVKKNR